MDLFHTAEQNILPFDGTVKYYGFILSKSQSNSYFDYLLQEIKWKNDQAIIFGKTVHTKRKVAWYGSSPFLYTYSKTTKTALPWTPELLELKQLVEAKTGETYNSCLLNLYHDGEEGMAWHSDGETDLKVNGAIASVSFGAIRKFCFKHKVEKQKIDIILDHGSLLVMKDDTQTNWLHRLPPSKVIKTARINLTFRTIETTNKSKNRL